MCSNDYHIIIRQIRRSTCIVLKYGYKCRRVAVTRRRKIYLLYCGNNTNAMQYSRYTGAQTPILGVNEVSKEKFAFAREGRRGGELRRRRVQRRAEAGRKGAQDVRREGDRRARLHLVHQLVERGRLVACVCNFRSERYGYECASNVLY